MVQESSNLSPEKQLLKLIEDPKGIAQRKAAIKRQGLNLLSWGGLVGRFSFLKGKTRTLGAGKLALNLKVLNRCLMLCVAGLGVYLSMTIYRNMQKMNEEPLDLVLTPAVERPVTRPVDTPLQNEGFYQDRIRGRDVFNIQAVEEKVEQIVEEQKQIPEIEKLAKNLDIVGISWSSDPDVMIEDTSAQKTYFLKRGDSLENGLKIEAVFRDHVILSYQGAEMELK